MRNFCAFAGLVITLTGIWSCSRQQSVKLFNGTDLEGWYTFIQDRGRNSDPQKVFTVQDGMIRISGEEWGCITTEQEYENYKLLIEFKWGELTYEPRIDRARDSGVLLHSRGEDGSSQGIWIHAIECQIIEGGTGGQKETIKEGRINWYGRDPGWEDTLGFRGQNDVENIPGKWNRLECIAEEDSLTFYLNGHRVNSAENVHPRKGRIQIQSEGAEIFFRRVEIHPIE